MNCFLDTNICIYYLKNSSQKLNERLQNFPVHSIKIPSIVAAELLYGAEKSAKREYNLQLIKSFLSIFDIISFDEKAAAYYAVIRTDLERKGKIIGNNDIIIAATVITGNGILITHNVDEFSRVVNLKMEDWTE